MPINVALVDFRASPAPAVELAAVAAALTRQGIEHFAVPPPNGWGIAASVTSGPPSTVQPGEWVLGLFDHPDQPGALGYHDRTPHGQPLMKVFPALCEQDGVKWSSCASHELLETLADPECALGAQAKTGLFWALEVCDAVEADGYLIDGVTVSNFVTPAYFQPPTSRKGVKLDHLGLVHTPFALRPGGYNQVFEPGQGWVQKTADQVRAYRANVSGRRHARALKLIPEVRNATSKGARVRWTLKDGTPGTGTVISDEENGRVLVAVDPKPTAPSAFSREVHPVIYCTVTWLTPLL